MSDTTTTNGLRLDVESLRVLREVVSANSFTGAADRLGMTQSAVSHKVRRLEERVGFDLLRRDGSTVEATPDGVDLLQYADDIVSTHDAAVEHIRRSPMTGAVRLGCNEEVAATELAEVAGRFRRTHPGVRLDVRVNESALVAEWFDAGDIDLALIQVMGDPARSPAGSTRMQHTDEIWRRDTLHVVQSVSADFEAVDPVPLLSFGPNCLYEPALTATLDRAGVRHYRAVECPSIQGVTAAIEAGLGVAVLNEPHVTDAMRPWARVAFDLPDVAFVLRARLDAGEPEQALRGHLHDALLGGRP